MAKGIAGKKTGGKARSALRSKSCLTNKQIGSRTGRSASTIAQIKAGSIKNPPKDLVTRINKLKCKK